MKFSRELGVCVLEADLIKVNIERHRRAEASGEFRKRYAVRAGIEGTNSELKRAHGLGHLRVRGGHRARLPVYLKALACKSSGCCEPCWRRNSGGHAWRKRR